LHRKNEEVRRALTKAVEQVLGSIVIVALLLGSGGVALVSAAPAEWSVPMEATTETEGNNPNLEFGTRASATDSYDSGIDVGHPPLGPGVTLDAYFSIDHSIFPELDKDSRGEADRIVWTLQAESDSEDITLTWDASVVPANISLRLTGTGIDIDMRAVASTALEAGDYLLKITATRINTPEGEVAAPDTKAPLISDIECSDCTKTSIIIIWRTNEYSTSQVEYWASEHVFSPLDESLVIYHEVELTNLKPCCVYHFCTISKDSSGNEAISEEQTFTTLGTPAAFTVSALSISPAEVPVGESITVSVLVANTGDATGIYESTLKIDNVVVVAKSVTLAGGASSEVTFTTSKDVAGTYTVSVDGQLGTVVVMTPQTPAPAPSEAKPLLNWPITGGIIAGVVIVGLLIFLLVIRRVY